MKSFFRFLYLNIYGLLLLLGGLGLTMVPVFQISVPLFVGKCLVVMFCQYKGIQILAQWPQKKKFYRQLIVINSRTIKESSFETFVCSPCGRLLTKAVLKSLGRSECYREIRQKYSYSVKEQIEDFLHPKPSKVFFYSPSEKYLGKDGAEK